MDFPELKDLLQQFDESTVRVLDLKKQDFQLFLSKDKQDAVSSVQTENNTTERPSQALASVEVFEESQPTVDSKPVATGSVVTSPLVGVVYVSPAPDQPTFKNVGDSVKKGEVLCIIEAMKIMNEITSDVDGVIEEVFIKNEDVVEYGQSLFRIV